MFPSQFLSVRALLGMAVMAWTFPLTAMAESVPPPLPSKMPTCEGETMPPADAQHLLCASTLGVRPLAALGVDSFDHGPDLLKALDTAQAQQAHLFLPKGVYEIKGSLRIPGGTGLVGSASGETALRNRGRGWAELSPQRHSTRGTLIEGLQLHGVRIVLRSEAPSIVRWNGLVDAKDADAQIAIHRGAHQVQGNVLWRTADRPGTGIAAGRPLDPYGEDAGGAGTSESIRIIGNWLGSHSGVVSDGFTQGAPDPEARTDTMLEALRKAKGVAMDEASFNMFSYFQPALRTWLPVPMLIERNHMRMTSNGRRRDGASSAVVVMNSPRFLSLKDNYFRFMPSEQNKGSVRIVSPRDVQALNNRFLNTTLVVDPGPQGGLPMKRVTVKGNLFAKTGIQVNVVVNGSGDDHTGPSDLHIFSNHFWSERTCPIQLRPPEAGRVNFDVGINLVDHDPDGIELDRNRVPVSRKAHATVCKT